MQNFKRPKWYDGGESNQTFNARRDNVLADLKADGYSKEKALEIYRDCWRERYATMTENGIEFMTWAQRMRFEKKMLEKSEGGN